LLLLIASLAAAACGSVGDSTASGPVASETASSDASAAPTADASTAAPSGPNADGVMPGDPSALGTDLPAFDPAAPAPSGGAAALRALAVLKPDVAALVDDVEAAERAALKAALASLPVQPTGSVRAGETVAASDVVVLAAAMRPAGPGAAPAAQAATSADSAVFLITLVSGLSDMFTPNVPPGGEVSGSGQETIGGATSTLSMDLGRSKDGSTNFGIGIQTDGSQPGVTAATDTAASIRGLRCPDANGKVKFTAKARFGADSGAAGSTEDLTATVTATVNDDATYVQTQIDVVQGAHRTSGGRQVYVQTGVTTRFAGNDVASMTFSNVRLISERQATPADVSDLSESGHTAALRMGLAALGIAQNNWRDGGCVKIVAASPGQVAPTSTTPIPVSVVGRFDNADVPSKLVAVLTGGASIDPASIAKTPGTLTYTAPDAQGKTATIALIATSMRGIATLTLTASTGGGAAYHVTGGLQDFQVDQDVCDITTPFTLDGKIGTAKYSGGLTGTYVANGGFGAHYDGEYVITLPNGLGQPGTMSGHIVGTTAGAPGSGTDHYTLTPLTTCG
jgi:hypothetical protein